MDTKKKLLPLVILASLSVNSLAQESDFDIGYLPKDSKVVNIEKGIINGEETTFVKYLSNKNSQIKEKIFDSKMNEVLKKNLKHPVVKKLGASLQAVMDENMGVETASFTVRVTLINPEIFEIERPSMMDTINISNGISKEEFGMSSSFDKNRKLYNKAYNKHLRSRSKAIKTIAKSISTKNGWKDSEYLVDSISENRDYFIVNLTKNEIDALMKKSSDYILNIDLHNEMIDSNVEAMLNSRVDPDVV